MKWDSFCPRSFTYFVNIKIVELIYILTIYCWTSVSSLIMCLIWGNVKYSGLSQIPYNIDLHYYLIVVLFNVQQNADNALHKS
jgi:hypothetical protein